MPPKSRIIVPILDKKKTPTKKQTKTTRQKRQQTPGPAALQTQNRAQRQQATPAPSSGTDKPQIKAQSKRRRTPRKRNTYKDDEDLDYVSAAYVSAADSDTVASTETPPPKTPPPGRPSSLPSLPATPLRFEFTETPIYVAELQEPEYLQSGYFWVNEYQCLIGNGSSGVVFQARSEGDVVETEGAGIMAVKLVAYPPGPILLPNGTPKLFTDASAEESTDPTEPFEAAAQEFNYQAALLRIMTKTMTTSVPQYIGLVPLTSTDLYTLTRLASNHHIPLPSPFLPSSQPVYYPFGIAMEMVHGINISALNLSGSRPEDVQVLREAAVKAVKGFHEAGVTHGNLKPENLVMRDYALDEAEGWEGEIVVVGWGAAAVLWEEMDDGEMVREGVSGEGSFEEACERDLEMVEKCIERLLEVEGLEAEFEGSDMED